MQLLTDAVMLTAERQEHARGVVGDGNYDVDLGAGTISFDGGPTLQCSVLGSASTEDGSWYWAWSNAGLNRSDDRLADSRQVRDEGARLSVPELTERRLAVAAAGPLSIHGLATVASSLVDVGGYQIVEQPPHVVVLATRSPLLALPELDADTFARTVTSAIGLFETPHQPAIAAYVARRGAQLSERGRVWDVNVGEQRVVLQFDRRGRLLELDRPDAQLVTGELVIERARAGLRDRGRRYRVLVDDVEQAKLAPGQKLTLTLPAGTHEVQMALDKTRSPIIQVAVVDGATVRVVAEPGGSFADARRDLRARPDSYISLRADAQPDPPAPDSSPSS